MKLGLAECTGAGYVEKISNFPRNDYDYDYHPSDFATRYYVIEPHGSFQGREPFFEASRWLLMLFSSYHDCKAIHSDQNLRR